MKCILSWLLLVLGIVLPAGRAEAQGMAPMPRPGTGPGKQAKEDKPAGPAEAAPEAEQDVEPELPPLPPWPGREEKRLRFFELHGYLRLRADMQNNHNLSQTDIRVGRAGETWAPFYTPISERSDLRCDARRTQPVVGTSTDRGISADDCPDRTLSGANMRLRLEPTINVGEQVRIHSQIDVFDNLVLGSTPNSLIAGGAAPDASLSVLSSSQSAPAVGKNTNTPAVLVKRAWAEVDTPVGELKFGRMPWNWGLGMLANDGSCWDCNFGDNRDRVMFTTSSIFGHRFGIGYDWASSGPNSLNVVANRPYYDRFLFGGQAVDLEQLDDVNEFVFFAGHIDRPEVIEEKVQRGEVVLNYGAYFLWRKQDFDFAAVDNGTLNRTEAELAAQLVERAAWFVIPDVWFKLRWRQLHVELEAAMIAGEINNTLENVDAFNSVSSLQYAFALQSRYAVLTNRLKFGLNAGLASGDDSELFDLNRRRQRLIDPSIPDKRLDEFSFNPDYIVDLILFREIMGTVANAAYFKPWVQFDLLDSLGARMDVIYSIAPKPVAYPGNSSQLGLELDFDLYYRNVEEGFYAGIQYGVLFPFAALDRPEAIYGADAQDAKVAQTLQGRLIVKF